MKHEEDFKWIHTDYILKPGTFFIEDLTKESGNIVAPDYSEMESVPEVIPEPVPLVTYKVYDLNDNLLGTSTDLEQARQIFKDRYVYWKGGVDMFIEEITE